MMDIQTVGETLAETAENRHCDLTPDCLKSVDLRASCRIGRENQSHTGQRLSSSGENENGPMRGDNRAPGLTTNVKDHADG